MKTTDRKLTAALAALVAACFLLAGAFALPVSAAEAPSRSASMLSNVWARSSFFFARTIFLLSSSALESS